MTFTTALPIRARTIIVTASPSPLCKHNPFEAYLPYLSNLHTTSTQDNGSASLFQWNENCRTKGEKSHSPDCKELKCDQKAVS